MVSVKDHWKVLNDPVDECCHVYNAERDKEEQKRDQKDQHRAKTIPPCSDDGVADLEEKLKICKLAQEKLDEEYQEGERESLEYNIKAAEIHNEVKYLEDFIDLK